MSSANSAEEIYGLQKSLEQEIQMHQDEMKTLKSQLERMTFEMKEMENTLNKKVKCQKTNK